MRSSSSSDDGRFPLTRWTLILRAKEGTEDEKRRARDELADMYHRPIFEYAKARGLNEHDAKDCAQDTLVKFLHSTIDCLDPLRGDRSARGVLYKMTRWAVSDFIREPANTRKVDDPNGALIDQRPDDAASPDEVFDALWAKNLLDRAVAEVRAEYVVKRAGDANTDAREREFSCLLDCVYKSGLKNIRADAATVLGISENAVGIAASRMRVRLRAKFDELLMETLHASATSEEVEAERAALIRFILRGISIQ